MSAAISKAGIVGKYRSGSDQDSVALMALFMHVGTRFHACEPSARGNSWRVLRARNRWRSDLSVERHRCLQRHQRNTVPDIAGEGLVQAAGFRLQACDVGLN